MMSEKEQETLEEPIASEKEQVFLDEERFLRQVRWRSSLRTVLIALGVLVAGFAFLVISTRLILNAQQNRIDSFYPYLIRYSSPNTIAVRGPWHDVGWLGQQQEYILVRMVGNHPVYVGTSVVDYQIWGGEISWDPDHTFIRVGNQAGPSEEDREYLLPGVVPRLKFYHPSVPHEQIPRQFNQLTGIPAKNTVEMALSFNRLLTREEMEALLPPGVEPFWGAISAYSEEEIAKAPVRSHGLVGLPRGGLWDGDPRQYTEEKFPEQLRGLSKIPSHYSRTIKRTADYLQQNGILYYGLVVCGKPADLLKLQDNPAVSAAVLGAVAGQE
ncbi:MAG: hypothetical protein C4589_08180 [Peptococcaceae bacterium]|nr:MAG: hypothetical protein C4589_08180 [Peptococcaceae bacterium]